MGSQFYDENGVPGTSDTLACAKAEDGKFYIKKCNVGINSGHFINPYGFNYNRREFGAYDSHSGRNYYDYAKVDESIFDDFLKFLKTRNQNYLRNAERSYQSGSH